MLGNLEILHDGTTGYHAVLEMLYTETFQRFCLEMSQEFLQGCLFGENPVIQFEGTVFAAEIFLEVVLSECSLQKADRTVDRNSPVRAIGKNGISREPDG